MVFRENQIYYIIGQGRDNTGTFLTNLDIRKVQSDVGCVNAKTVVYYKDGIAFLSNKGMRLLLPQLTVDNQFEVVEDFDKLTFTSAVVLEDTEEVRWTSLEGTSLVYNYLYGKWSSNTGQPAVGAVIWDGNYVYLRPDGVVMVEDKTVFHENGEPYSLKISTGFLRMNGIAGFGRLWEIDILGNYRSEHVFRMDLAYNDEAFVSESKVWVPKDAIFEDSFFGREQDTFGLETETFGGANPENNCVYNFVKKPRKRRCNSVQITISDIPGTGSGESFDINTLTLTVGIRDGGRRHSDSREF